MKNKVRQNFISINVTLEAFKDFQSDIMAHCGVKDSPPPSTIHPMREYLLGRIEAALEAPPVYMSQ